MKFVDPCDAKPCPTNDVCEKNGLGGHICHDPCVPNLCENGGTCDKGVNGSYTCICGEYSGVRCEIGECL